MLRQDPDVILVGEMRDLETMEAAITAAETGHLVFRPCTPPARRGPWTASSTPSPPRQQEQIRIQLAGNLKAVLSQVLIPRKDERGRVAAVRVDDQQPGDRRVDPREQDLPHPERHAHRLEVRHGVVGIKHGRPLQKAWTHQPQEVLSRAQDRNVAQQLLREADDRRMAETDDQSFPLPPSAFRHFPFRT